MQTTLNELLIECAPRNIFLRPAQIKDIFDINVSDMPHLSLNKDPSLLHINSPKHNTAQFNKYLLQNYTRGEIFSPVKSLYGVSSCLRGSTHSNYWLHCQQNDVWYWNQYKALKISQILKTVPGIKTIRLSGSSSMECSDKYSDIDLIIEAKQGWVWVVRLWSKLFLKLIGQDVYQTRFQLLKLAAKLGIVSSKSVKKSIVEFKKRRRHGIDIGLITINWQTFSQEHISSSPHNVFFRTTKLLYSSARNSEVDLILEYNAHGLIKITQTILSGLLFALSVILYPIIYMWASVYLFLHKNQSEFVVNYNTICFYPLKPVLYGVFVGFENPNRIT